MIEAVARTTEVNPAKLAMLYKRELELCKVKPGDTIALVSDLGTRREYIQATFAAADELGARRLRDVRQLDPGLDQGRRADDRQVQRHAGGAVGRRPDRDLSRAAVCPLAQDRHGQAGARPDDHRRA